MGLGLFDVGFDDAPTPAAFAARFGERLGWALSFRLAPLGFSSGPSTRSTSGPPSSGSPGPSTRPAATCKARPSGP